MSTWRNPPEWQRWLRGDDCPICRSLGSDAAVAELEVTRLMMPEQGPMRGYVWLPLRRHAVELHDLTAAEGEALMRDLRRVSAAIAHATDAVKLNYEIHGNTVPHLHVHVFPRYVGDPFEGGPIDPRAVTEPVYAAGEHAALTARVRDAISEHPRSTRVHRHIAAPRSTIYRLLLDPTAIAQWKVPDGMTAQVHAFEAREGGMIRVSLTYDSPDAAGKSMAHTDTYHGRFVRLVPDEMVVEADEFETDDPALRGEMISTITLADAPDGGTDVVGVHENVPAGVSVADNETGWRMALREAVRR